MLHTVLINNIYKFILDITNGEWKWINPHSSASDWLILT